MPASVPCIFTFPTKEAAARALHALGSDETKPGHPNVMSCHYYGKDGGRDLEIEVTNPTEVVLTDIQTELGASEFFSD
jgi:hypothetical protein